MSGKNHTKCLTWSKRSGIRAQRLWNWWFWGRKGRYDIVLNLPHPKRLDANRLLPEFSICNVGEPAPETSLKLSASCVWLRMASEIKNEIWWNHPTPVTGKLKSFLKSSSFSSQKLVSSRISNFTSYSCFDSKLHSIVYVCNLG